MRLFKRKRKPKKDEYYYEIYLDWDKVKTVEDIKILLTVFTWNHGILKYLPKEIQDPIKKYCIVKDTRTDKEVEYDIVNIKPKTNPCGGTIF